MISVLDTCRLNLSFLFQVKDIIVSPELFSVQNGLLTPTFKNKRPQLRKFFAADVKKLYQLHEQ